MAFPALIPLIAAGVGAAASAGGAAAGSAGGANTFRSSNFMDGKHYNPSEFEYGHDSETSRKAKEYYLNQRRAIDQREGVQLDQQAYGLSRDAAMGNAPSQAQNLLRGAQDEALGQTMSMAGSVKGGPGARLAAMRNAQSVNARQQAAGANQMAALRAQEMATARGQYAGMAGQQAQLSAQQRALNDQRAMGYEQQIQGVDMAQLQAGIARNQLGAQSHASADAINARINQENANNTKEMWKGVAAAVSGGASGVAGGMGGGGGMPSDVSTKVPTTMAPGPIQNALGGIFSDDSTKLEAAYQRGLRVGREQGYPEARDEGEIDAPPPYLGEAEDIGPTRKIRQPTSFEVVRGRHVALGRMADSELAEKRAGYAKSLEAGPAVGQREPDTAWLDREMARRGETGGVPMAGGEQQVLEERALQAEDLRRRAAEQRASLPSQRESRARELASRDPMPSGLIPQLLRIYQDSQAAEAERDATTSDEAAKKAAYERGAEFGAKTVREHLATGRDTVAIDNKKLSPRAAEVVGGAALDAQKDKVDNAYVVSRGHRVSDVYKRAAEANRMAEQRAADAAAADDRVLRNIETAVNPAGAITRDAAKVSETHPVLQGARRKLDRATDQLWMANPAAAMAARAGTTSDYTAKDGKLPTVGVGDMADAMRKMRPTSYAYKDQFRPAHQKPGETNVGPVANDMAEDDVAGTAVFRDGGTGKLAIDKEKGLKLALGGLAALQAQIDEMGKKVKGKGRRRG